MLDRLLHNDLDAFLQFIYGDLQGYMVVAELHKDGDQERMYQYGYFWPNQKESILEHIRRTGPTVDTFYTPALFSQPVAQKQFFLHSQVAWVEFDGSPNFGGHKPSLRLQSSTPGHEHWYYRMVTPIDSVEELERYNKALAYTLGGDYGWAANKLLRPVGASNHKYSERPQVSVLNVFPEVWPKGELDAGWVEPHSKVDLTEGPLILPRIGEVLLKYAWPERAAELFQWPSCPPGTRSDSLMALGYYTAEMGMDEAEIMAVLIHADDRWEKFKNRHDRIHRLNEIIQIAKQKHPGESKDTSVLNTLIQNNVLGGWLDILNSNVSFEWIIENVLLRNTNLVLVGRQNVGKTQLSMRFGMNMALGNEKFLGFKINSQQRIMFLSLELGIVPLKLLTTKMSTGLSEEEREKLQENFITAAIGESLHLYTGVGQENMEKLVDMVKPDGIIVDSLGKVISSPSKEDQAIAASDYLDRLSKRGLFVWGIHHQRKTGQGETASSPELDDAYGNQYITAFARSSYGLYDLGTGLRFKQLKNNFAPKPDHVLAIERTPDLNFNRTGEINEDQETKEKASGKLYGEK